VTDPRLVAALRAQLTRRRELLDGGARHVGWKIAKDIAEIDAVTGGAPAFGYITTASVLPEAATFDPAGCRELRAETELVVDVGPDGMVAAYAVGLELVDVGRPPSDLEGIVADDVFHRAVVLGSPFATAAVAVEPRTLRATLLVDGEERECGEVELDGAGVVRAVAEVLDAAGERLQAGDRVLAGSVCHVPVGAGDEIVAAIDGLGRVSARIAG
jgi:2-keto-4-pentenoate hydratase